MWISIIVGWLCPQTAKTHLYDIFHPMSPLNLKYYNLNSSNERFRKCVCVCVRVWGNISHSSFVCYHNILICLETWKNSSALTLFEIQNVINFLSQNEGRWVVLKPIGFGNEKEVFTTENLDLNSFNNQTEEANALDIFEGKSLHPHACLSMNTCSSRRLLLFCFFHRDNH